MFYRKISQSLEPARWDVLMNIEMKLGGHRDIFASLSHDIYVRRDTSD